jgi:hypothetical protein
MGLGIGIAVGVIVLAVLFWRLFLPGLGPLVDQAAKSGDLGPLLAALQKMREGAQPAAYNHAIRRLWDGYQRELAARLARELARNFGTVPISQYWLRQILQVEPGIAKVQFDQEFLNTYYVPEVAARCGPAG